MVKKIAIVFIFIFGLFSGVHTARAFDCLTLNSNSSSSERSFCQDELSSLLKQLDDLNNQLSNQKKNTGNIKGDIDYLTTQINALKTKIKARGVAIANLKVSINEKKNKIEDLSEKIANEKQSLGQLLRNTNELDNKNIIHLLMIDTKISDFYSDLESYSSIKNAIKTSVEQITGVKVQTQEQQNQLQKQQDMEADAKAQLELAQKQVAKNQDEKKQLLAISKQKEADYQKVIATQQKRVSDIKARLFQLAGGASAIRFDVALGFAENANRKTGIDPAFLLAILTQESNLGSNVGKCYLTDSATGAGVNVNTGKVWSNLMKPTRDVTPFLEITSALGFNAYKTAVSCPIAGVQGYGGAMGPAQFIPSTWKMFVSRIRSITGSSTPNPWDPQDAFIASALYLTDLGAVGDSVSAQKRAACKYYGSGGSSCSYGNSVIKLKNKIQLDIDYLKQYGVAKN